MQAKELIHDYQMSHWADIIRQRAESGLTVKEFCRSRGFNKSKYFYWQRRLRDKACNSLIKSPLHMPDTVQMFTEVTVTQQSPQPASTADGQIRIEAYGMRITADSSYPPVLIAALLREVAPVC